MRELATLLATKTDGTVEPEGSHSDNCSTISDTASVTSNLALSNNDFPLPTHVELGPFSSIHPPVDKSILQKILNNEFIDFSKLFFSNDKAETTTIKNPQHQPSCQPKQPQQDKSLILTPGVSHSTALQTYTVPSAQPKPLPFSKTCL